MAEALQPIAAAVTAGVEMGFASFGVWRRGVGIIPPCVLLSWSTRSRAHDSTGCEAIWQHRRRQGPDRDLSMDRLTAFHGVGRGGIDLVAASGYGQGARRVSRAGFFFPFLAGCLCFPLFGRHSVID